MMEWLNEDFPGQENMINLGVGASASMTVPSMEGNTYIWKKCGLDLLPEATVLKQDVAFIEFSVNDAYQPYNISVDQSRKNLEHMIDALKQADPDVEIVLQTMNVVIDMPELNIAAANERPELKKYLRMYRRVAKENRLLLIDHFPNWKKYLRESGRDAYLELVSDGIHPNLEGYRKILLPELRKKLFD